MKYGAFTSGREREVGHSEVRDAILQANKDENEFLAKWGAAAFIELVCR
jgi:hypothetical protein